MPRGRVWHPVDKAGPEVKAPISAPGPGGRNLTLHPLSLPPVRDSGHPPGPTGTRTPPSYPIVFRKMPSPIPALTCHLCSRPASPKGMKAFLDHHLNKRSRNQTRKSGPSLPSAGTYHQPRPAWAVDGAGSTQGRG